MMSSKQNFFLLQKHNSFPKGTIWKNKECFLIMISSFLEILLITNTFLGYKLILHKILSFPLNLLFHTGKSLPSQLIWNASNDIQVSSKLAPGEYYEPKNKQKCTEPKRKTLSGDLMKLNDTDMNYTNFGDEVDSDKTMKTFCFKKACFILNSLV